ncbi:hypothetical protein JQS43_15735 [Natronosporangium hydrolyticum]|uniref:PH domain-containing protein n=1 Tax=Natronosporangium hydrolyticum TaxID=2811111 RepID=A0A895YFX4_9ACTN|nr:hypothetical protein [Natronosporangium hydrolyticum]QSB13090.1 hypothetical protein JQS43_15735 [Natronosporangium hydrolyticum]
MIHGAAATGPPQPPRPELPRPAEWPERPGRSMVGDLVFLGVLTVFLAAMAAGMLATGATQVAAVFLGMTTLVVLVTAGVVPLHRVSRRAVGAIDAGTAALGEAGVRLRYSAWWYTWVLVLIASLGAGPGALALYLFVGGGEYQSPQVVMALIGVVSLPFALWFGFEVLRGGVTRGEVLLTPRGIHHRGMIHKEFVAWEDVFGVAAVSRRGLPVILVMVAPGRLQWEATSSLSIGRKPGGPTDLTPVVELSIYLFPVDPVLAYHALEYYRTRREARAELATNAGPQRIRSGALLSR